MVASPLFSFLEPRELANLVSLIRTKRLAAGTTIIQEGDPGTALYIIARGRVVIYCRNFQGNKVYLSSLSDGDCVGEFSFFTGEPRAATVETLDEVLLFEIQHGDFDRILEGFPNLTNALLSFYKDRVVATLLAKSEVFGVLPLKVRASLLERLGLEQHGRGDVVLKEGERSDGFYLIKSGEVEVYSERSGYVFLSKLKSGDFFGEIAAITGEPRTASVRALGTCELLRLSGGDLQDLAHANPEMMAVLEHRIALREAETARRLTAGGLLI
jgi:CRP-like cAMP-binding protein